MNQSELKEAVKQLEGEYEHYSGIGHMKPALRAVLNLAQQYLNIKEPEHKSVGSQECSYHTGFYNAGFNEALHLCKLAQMKKLDGLEEVIETIIGEEPLYEITYKDKGVKITITEYGRKLLCNSIRQHMGGK
jgi:hypothetical protein